MIKRYGTCRSAMSGVLFALGFYCVLTAPVVAQTADKAAKIDAGMITGQAEQPAETELKSWFEPAEPMKIVGPINFVGTRGLAVYLITTSQGHILLFGAMPQSAALVELSIRKLGFKPEDIRIMITCHAHIDHVGTHAHFKKLSGAQIAMMAEEVELLQSGGKTDFHYSHLPPFLFEPVTVDRVLRDGDTVTLGDVILTAYHTPGHTKGGTTWAMNVVEGGKVYQVVFPDGTSINPGYRIVRNPSYPGIAGDSRRTLHIHETLKPDIWLHSHASFFDFEGKRARAAKEGASAWIDPEGYRRFVISRRNILESAIDAELASIDINGSSWQLVKFQGGDGATLTPADKTKYTLEFGSGGRVSVRIDCNRGSGAWKLGGWNQIVLGPLALTRAACPPEPLNDRFARDWESIRSYVIKDGRLFLSLMADGGTYEFEPAPGGASARR